MSTDLGETINRIRLRSRSYLFGDRIGLALFLGTIVFAALYWRAGIFITDNETLVRTFEAVSDGRFWIEPATGEGFFDGPGAEVRDGYVYGRNYGQLVVSLPFLWFVRALDYVADIRLALVAIWHLVLLTFVVQLSYLLDRTRVATIGGSVAVGILFLLNLFLATQLPNPSVALLALQLASLVATGFIAVFCYRLVAIHADTRIAVITGSASVVVLPVGFWATIPKRHVFSVLICFVILYLFARSRNPDTTVSLPVLGDVPAHRGAAYALVGFLTWINAAEGLFVFLALLAVDLPTAPTNDRRTLAFLGTIFAISLLPTVLTNLSVTGDLVRPPRTLGGQGITAPAAETTTDGASTGSSDSGTQLWDLLPDFFVFSVISWIVSNIFNIASESLTALTNANTFYHILVRSAGTSFWGGNLGFQGTNLSVLESAPILGAAIGLVTGAVLRAHPSRLTSLKPRRLLGRIDPTAALAVGFVIAFCAIYLQKLPLHIQVNMRYLLPVYPLALYLLVRSNTVRQLVSCRSRSMIWSYTGSVLLGTQLFVAYIVQAELAVAEAAQLNAIIALLLTAVVALTVFLLSVDHRFEIPAAISVGVAAGAGTLFLLVSGIYYFSVAGEAILPIVEFISDLLP